MSAEASELFDRYVELVERASAARFVPSGGLTPREFQYHLDAAGVGTPDELARLTAILEQCVYGCLPDAEAALEGAALCGKVIAALPEISPPRGPGLRQRCASVARVVMPWIAMAGGLALLVFVLTTAPLSIGGIQSAAPTINSTWNARYGHEANAAGASERQWNSAPSNPTWTSHRINTTLDATQMSTSRRPGIDTDTGTDGTFENATDPFDPPLNWTHRLHVFTFVDANYIFRPSQPPLHDATGAATGAAATYIANVNIRLQAWQPVPIPSPTPDAVVTSASCSPHATVQFYKDQGDGLLAVGNRSGTVRLEYTLATWQDYSFAPLPAVRFEARNVPMPSSVRSDAQRVIEAIGGLPQPTYEDTVRRLHQYFAGFSVAPLEPHEQLDNSYLTVAMSRKGVCRHRARAFFITANALGVETRLVENRTHSFCEVRLPNEAWRRMEFRLGDGEGPPGPDTPLSARFAAVGNYLPAIALPFAIVLLSIMLLVMHHRDVSGHLIRDRVRTPRALRRAQRDSLRHQSDDCKALVALVRDRVAMHCGFDPTNREHLRLLFHDQSIPDSIRPRMRRLFGPGRLYQPTDSIDLQATYWDCYYILHWIEDRQP